MRAASVVALLGIATGVARAEPSDKDKKSAGDLVQKAIARSHAGEHQAAIALYRQAYELIPNPVLLSNIATELEADGQPKDALRYFCQYLAAEPQGSLAGYATQHARKLQDDAGDHADVCAAPKPVPAPPPTPSTVTAAPTGVIAQEGTASQAKSALVPAGIVVGAVGVAGLGVMSAYLVIGAHRNSDVNGQSQTGFQSNIDTLIREGHDANRNAEIAGIAGGALIATGVVLILVGRHHEHAVQPAAGGIAIAF
ncbi:MAG TPA: hypothetical protein VGM88_27845 [Kofleriaceae bacterium]